MSLSIAEELELIHLEDLETHYQKGRKLWQYFPETGPVRRGLYQKHLEFFRAGKDYPLRLMLKGNRVGGTEGFGCEFTYHLTGLYPDWWEGRRFTHPVVTWAAGDTNPKTQEILQAKLLGTKDARLSTAIGTGIIPRDTITGLAMRAGVPGAVETVRVRHVTGEDSVLTLKSFEQGVESFQGNEVHIIWLDEQAPLAILAESVVRLTPTAWFEGGMLAWTVTPEEGLTDAILEFLPEGEIPVGPQSPPKFAMAISWDDVPHLSAAAKATLTSGIPAYQLDARSRGIPVLGAGVVFPLPEADYLVEPFALPKHWLRCYGMDVGWNRTACPWGAYDRENDTWYLYHEHYRGHEEPSVHAAAIQGPGDWIPGVIDPAANGRSQADGTQLLVKYRQLGLHLTEANNARESGIYEMWERLSQGRLKVFTSLTNWRKEARLFRRDDKGRIVNEHDFHLMAATRYLLLSGQKVAKAVPVARARTQEDGLAPVRGHLAWMG